MPQTTLNGSFITVKQADSYWQDMGGNDAWSSAKGSEKKAALREASTFISSRFDWDSYERLGEVEDKSQFLAFPRKNAENKNGADISGKIPDSIVKATAYLAAQVAGGLELFGQTAEGLDSIGVGPIDIDFGEGSDGETTFGYLQSVLSNLIDTNATVGSNSDFHEVDLIRT